MYKKIYHEYKKPDAKAYNTYFYKGKPASGQEVTKALNDLIKTLNAAPIEYRNIISVVSNALVNPQGMIRIYGNSLYFPSNPGYIVKSPSYFWKMIVGMAGFLDPFHISEYTSLRYNKDYIKRLFHYYCVYILRISNEKVTYRKYMCEICSLPESDSIIRTDLLYNPLKSFYCIDNNLYWYISNLIQNPYSKVPPCFLQRHKTAILKLFNSTVKYLPPDHFFSSAPSCVTNYSFNIIYHGIPAYAYIEDSALKIQTHTNPTQGEVFRFDLQSIPKIHLSDSCIQFLMDITGGRQSEFEILAKLCAITMTNYYSNDTYNLPSKNVLPLTLFVIYSSKESASLLNKYLSILNKNESDIDLMKETKIIDLESISESKFFAAICGYNLSKCSGYIATRPSPRNNKRHSEDVNNIIKRKGITKTLPTGQDVTWLNHLPILCFVNTEEELRKLKEKYPTKVFQYTYTPNKWSDVSLTKEDRDYLRVFLSIYGLLLIYNSNFHIKLKRSSSRHYSTDSVKGFVRNCIKVDHDSYIYADTLYNTYEAYYHLRYPGEPLKRVQFIKEIQQICQCDYKKPRHSRDDNRYALIGIRFDTEKAKRFIENEDQIHTQNGFIIDSFKQDILEPAVMNVNELLKELWK